MEWFGITYWGFSNAFRDMIKPGYVEPTEFRNLLEAEAAGKLQKPFYEELRSLDTYMDEVDGYAYRSNERLHRMRTKGLRKPVGPTEMYRYPGCISMEIGWWVDDPALKDAKWLKVRPFYPQPMSEATKYVVHQLRSNKQFQF